jgi:putative transposase
MPRANRYLQAGHAYHLTHRCHDRRFLLKFVRDRDCYRKWLYEAVKRYGVAVYNYCITSNHVHLVVHVDDTEQVGLMMHLVAGAFARQRNSRKRHEGSVWEHPYQCTLVQSGEHLMNCIRYVSLNMVRAGVVPQPSQWAWCGDDELMGTRSRYRILDTARMLENLELDDLSEFRRLYEEGIRDQIQRRMLRRDPTWTRALAVGDRVFVQQIAESFKNRCQFTYSQAACAKNAWMVQESAVAYGLVSPTESESKPLQS